MTLRDYFSSLDRFGVVPILGYAGLKIGGLTAQQCLHDPRLHAELVRNNLQQFEPDAVISLMDLTVEAESYGVNPLFSDYDPPEIRTYLPLDNVTASLHQTHTDRMSLMVEAAKQISQQVKDVPTGFFVTGPFTLAGQILGVQQLLLGLLRSEAVISKLIADCTETVVGYAKRLGDAGVDFLVMADMSSSLISPRHFEQFAKTPLSLVVEAVSTDIILHICGRVNHLLKQMGETGVAAISIDQTILLSDAVKAVPSDVLVFGNYSPTNLSVEKPETIRTNVTQMLTSVGGAENLVASSGCNLPSSTPADSIKTFIQAVKSHKKAHNL
ncbi:MAG: uroporphyrinogen decarboxylase family protein [Candidatus Bathyarchaeia archaeon]